MHPEIETVRAMCVTATGRKFKCGDHRMWSERNFSVFNFIEIIFISGQQIPIGGELTKINQNLFYLDVIKPEAIAVSNYPTALMALSYALKAYSSTSFV
jgi:hypothetical protein